MLGDNLKTIRKAKRLKAHEVVDLMKKHGSTISLSSYYAWENNERNIPHKHIPAICMSLNITIDFLYMVNTDSPLFEDKVAHIEKVKDFLCMLDDDVFRMLFYLNRAWNGDFIAVLNMIGAYAAQPKEMRRDVYNLCLHNFLKAVEDGEADKDISPLVNVDKYISTMGYLYDIK